MVSTLKSQIQKKTNIKEMSIYQIQYEKMCFVLIYLDRW